MVCYYTFYKADAVERFYSNKKPLLFEQKTAEALNILNSTFRLLLELSSDRQSVLNCETHFEHRRRLQKHLPFS